MTTGRPLLTAGEVGAALRPLAAFDPGWLGNDALTGLSLSLLCAAVLAVCGHRLWRELAVRLGWRPPGALVGVTALTSVAIVASLIVVPTTPAFPRLEERRHAIQALGDELLGQVTGPDGVLPPVPAATGAGWRVPAPGPDGDGQPHRYVYRPPLVPMPLAEIGDWIILHEPATPGGHAIAFTGSGRVLELGGDELLDRLKAQSDVVTAELKRIALPGRP